MNILCTICARGNSKGLINKNIIKLNGAPLIKHTIDQAKKSKIFKDIVVSSDNRKILSVAKKSGIENMIVRPANLSNDKAEKLGAIKHALLSLEKLKKKKYDIIIDLNVTSPLRNINDKKNPLSLFLKKKASIVISASESKKNPYFNQVFQLKNRVKLVRQKKKKIQRRQDTPRVYDLNASIYVYKRYALLKSNSIYTNKSYLYVMPYRRSVDIDDKLDFKIVEYLMRNKN